jgi:hypothetical protein
MQRRAAAVYFTLFVVLGAAAYGFIQVGMSDRTIQDVELDGPTYVENDTLTVDGTEFTVSSVGFQEGSFTGELTTTNESFRATASLSNGSTTTYLGEEYRVDIANETGVSTFTLVKTQNVSAILAADPAVRNTTTEVDGVENVIYVANNSLRPLADYLPEPETVSFAEGDELEYQADAGNVTATVDNVTASAAQLSWPSTNTQTFSLSEGGNVTLAGQTHFVHFTGNDTVQVLPTDSAAFASYQTELETVDYYEERKRGVWGVVILSVLAAIVLLATAYLPVK